MTHRLSPKTVNALKRRQERMAAETADSAQGDSPASSIAVVSKEDAVKASVTFTGHQVSSAWMQSKLSHLQLVSTNKKYRALPKTTWDLILGTHPVVHVYEAEFWDCDAYSAAMVGQILLNYDINGIVRVLDNSAGHSYNAVLCCDDGKTCYWLEVEPQANAFVGDPPKGVIVTAPDGAYKAQSGFAITA